MPYSPVNTQASGMRFSPYRIGAKNIAKTTKKCHITHQEQKTDTQTTKGLWAERGQKHRRRQTTACGQAIVCRDKGFTVYPIMSAPTSAKMA